MESTQTLGVGLGLVVRIDNQYSHPVCMGRCTDAYATINGTQEISWTTSYLLGNIYTGIGEIVGMGYHVDDRQMIQRVELQLMTSWGSHTKQLHKSIAQMKSTKQLHKTRYRHVQEWK